jgi:tRNA 2-thiouridine synthesizing protein A
VSRELESLKTLLKKKGEMLYELDLKGYTCPYPQLFTAKALGEIEVGAILEVLIDNPPSTETVPRSIRNVGQEYVKTEKLGPSLWRIVARRIK